MNDLTTSTWTESDAERFATQRLQAFDAELSATEQRELATLQQRFDAEEVRQMTPSDEATAQLDERFNALRHKALAGGLSSAEQTELSQMRERRTQQSDASLDAVVTRLTNTQTALRQELSQRQAESEALAHLLLQQEQLIADANAWISEFDERTNRIHQTYTRLTGQPLPT